MATLVLTALGTAIGGPIGGAIGAYLGQQADRALFAGGPREGPRLRELAVTTSSYGQPIPRQFGRMRVAGSVIWATDLAESSATSGGKGQPKTTTYSYSASFAVALSSTPIARVGRIWADGNLLRGAGGDLKVPGAMRVYTGAGDSPVDPLIAADHGAQAPAFRDCAYVVFEDLELADYGNRIPALTFEIFGLSDEAVALADLVPDATTDELVLAHTRGFADEGGPLSATLSAIDAVFPLTCATSPQGLRLASAIDYPATPVALPEQLSTRDSEEAGERPRNRADRLGEEPMALRYYDEARDYQPAVQRAIGSRASGRERMVDLPATMSAQGAKQLANDSAHRARWQHERINWRIGQLDPALQVGGVARLPDRAGLWRVLSWEWHAGGIELGLERLAPGIGAGTVATSGADTGIASPPADLEQTPSVLHVFEAPPENAGDPAARRLYAAVSSRSPAWRGASLFAVQGDALVPFGTSGGRRAALGELAAPLAPSASLMFEPQAGCMVELVGDGLDLEDTDLIGLANGANRMLIGSEVIQFARALPAGERVWHLRGLLRGRAGTEEAAAGGHAAGERAVLLDDRLTVLDGSQTGEGADARFAGIGRADPQPVYADLANPGLSRRPPVPVHPRARRLDDGSLELCWIRRARGQWIWSGATEVPLVEEREAYTIGFGPPAQPFTAWTSAISRFVLAPGEADTLVAAHGSGPLWVRQDGTHASSGALLLANLF